MYCGLLERLTGKSEEDTPRELVRIPVQPNEDMQRNRPAQKKRGSTHMDPSDQGPLTGTKHHEANTDATCQKKRAMLDLDTPLFAIKIPHSAKKIWKYKNRRKFLIHLEAQLIQKKCSIAYSEFERFFLPDWKRTV